MNSIIDYDQLASEYARHRQVHPLVLRDLAAAVSRLQAGRILEVGCGTGNYIRALQQASQAECWGLDPSEQMLEKARERSGGLTLQQGRAEELPFDNGFFDLVFSVDVIHHVNDRPAYYRQARRVLRPGGLICTITDSEEIIYQRKPLTNYFPETVEAELKRYPPIPVLREMMTAAGFEALREDNVSLTYTTTDIQRFRDKAYSSLHLISAEAFQRGIQRMEDDLRQGPIECVSLYVLLWGARPEA